MGKCYKYDDVWELDWGWSFTKSKKSNCQFYHVKKIALQVIPPLQDRQIREYGSSFTMQQKLQQSHLDISCPKEKSSNYTLHVWISHLTENITTMTSGKYLCRLDGPQEFLRTVEISSLQVDQRFQNTGKRGPDVHYRFLVPSTPMDNEPFR